MEFSEPSNMKWSGWGHPHRTFPLYEKPELWPFISRKIQVEKKDYTAPVSLESIKLPPVRLTPEHIHSLRTILSPERVSTDFYQRLTHSFGKSFPDLWRIRHAKVDRSPDAVVWPKSHAEVLALINWAKEHHLHLIPFGGGTNIVNALEVKSEATFAVISVDMRAMNQLLEIDTNSNLALIEAGATGPVIEESLGQHGFSLGHFPDSFEFSTLGGWIATRSAGMQSDAYGRIEDMVRSLHVASAQHDLQLKPFPASSAGPDLNRPFIGSEGCFGIITKAWMQIHQIPAEKYYCGYLFRSFEEGLQAIRECYRQDVKPSLLRLQDEGETELAFHLKSAKPLYQTLLEKPLKKYISLQGYQNPALLVIGFEGTLKNVRFEYKNAHDVLKKFGAFSLGNSIGDAWSKDKYNTPYLRDTMMDYGAIADVAETATSWTQIYPLYLKVLETVDMAAKQEGLSHYIGCHLSHTYSTGGCLYFTWGLKGGPQPLDRYYKIKTMITQAIVDAGGTLSHHHAVGTEHLPWLVQEIGQAGSGVLNSLKDILDPHNIFNPGGLKVSRAHDYINPAQNAPAST